MDKERLNHVISRVIRYGVDIEQIANKAERLQAELEGYKNRQDYGDYNFNIKIQKIDVPGWVREILNENKIEDEIDGMASGTIRSLISRLLKQFKWVKKAWQDGQKWDWLAIQEEETLFESMISAQLIGDVGEMQRYIREMESTLRDLAKIEKIIDRTIQDFIQFVESDNFWEGTA